MPSQINTLLQMLFRSDTEVPSQKNILLFVSHIAIRMLESIRLSTALRNNHYINEQELEDNVEAFGKAT
jgi:hypothetical protein